MSQGPRQWGYGPFTIKVVDCSIHDIPVSEIRALFTERCEGWVPPTGLHDSEDFLGLFSPVPWDLARAEQLLARLRKECGSVMVKDIKWANGVLIVHIAIYRRA